MKIGLLGGTFNPIHVGHLEIAEATRSRVGLDEVLFVPVGMPPHKPKEPPAEARHRLEMVRLAIEDHPYFGVTDLEVRRPGPSYSIETVRQLQRDHPKDEFFFILGLDAFLEIESWRSADELLRLCHFVVLSRSGYLFRKLVKPASLTAEDTAVLDRLDQGKQEQADFQLRGGPHRLYLLRIPALKMSSTAIRRNLRAGRPLEGSLPGPVESYIIKNRLYLD
jgi:nicotinate-nucleotide adenylyltransferase